MFIFPGNSRTFRGSGMFFNGVFAIKLVLFGFVGGSTSSMQFYILILFGVVCSFFVVILVLFGVTCSFVCGNSRTFRCSVTSGTDVDFSCLLIFRVLPHPVLTHTL